MRKIIYIGGITSSGKTTTAEKLGKFLDLPVIKADDVYSMIGREVHHLDPQQLVMPETWFPGMGEMKKKYYKELIPEDGDFIIEGFPLGFEQDRQLIQEIVGTHDKVFFLIDLPYHIWAEFSAKKFGKAPSRNDYVHLNGYFEHPEKYYRIRDSRQLFVTADEYQKFGFTDIKWEKIGLGPKDLLGKRVADLGCNSGWIGEYCYANGARVVDGYDYNWRYLEMARSREVNPYLVDLDNLVLQGSYDVIFCLATFHYVIDKQKLLKKIAEATREVFILEIPISHLDHDVLELHNTGKAEYFIPSLSLITKWLSRLFISVEVSTSIAPDNSTRKIFKCYK